MKEIDGKLFSFETFFTEEELNIPVGKVYQIGELSLVRGGEIPEHNQYCDEITYAVSGSAEIFSDGESFTMRGGEVHFMKRGAYHKILAGHEENFRYICIGFMPDENNADIAPFFEAIEGKKQFVLKSDNNLRTLCELLIDETYTNDAQSHKMINLYTTQILLSLCRLLKGKAKRAVNEKTSSGYAIYHTLRYIDREYISIKSVKSIAKELSYSEYYLSHLFKEKMGMSIKEYIIEKKLKTAAVLLKTTELGVGEIAEYLSFSVHTFGQAFKRYYKMSPSEFKATDSKF